MCKLCVLLCCLWWDSGRSTLDVVTEFKAFIFNQNYYGQALKSFQKGKNFQLMELKSFLPV